MDARGRDTVCGCTLVTNAAGTITCACTHIHAFAPAETLGASKIVALGSPALESSALFMMKRLTSLGGGCVILHTSYLRCASATWATKYEFMGVGSTKLSCGSPEREREARKSARASERARERGNHTHNLSHILPLKNMDSVLQAGPTRQFSEPG